MEQEMQETDKEIIQLEAQLKEAAAAENFFETASGRLSVEIATKEINKLVKQICGKEFLNNHTGYVNAVTALHARQDWLKRLQVAGAPQRINRIKEELENRGVNK